MYTINVPACNEAGHPAASTARHCPALQRDSTDGQVDFEERCLASGAGLRSHVTASLQTGAASARALSIDLKYKKLRRYKTWHIGA